MMKKALGNILLTAVFLGIIVASIPLFASSLQEMSSYVVTVGTGKATRKEYKRCSKPRSLRLYATVENCLEFENLDYQKVLQDVSMKSMRCGAKPSWWHQIRRMRYQKCMGSQ